MAYTQYNNTQINIVIANAIEIVIFFLSNKNNPYPNGITPKLATI
jgi:hypothetical protein